MHEQQDKKPTLSSAEILSELFNSFNVEPPIIIKKEKSDSKKHKKKHKKHHKKSKKRSIKKERRDSTTSGGNFTPEIKTNEPKIKLKNTVQISTIFETTIREIQDEVKSDEEKRKKKKHKQKSKKRERSRSLSPDAKHKKRRCNYHRSSKERLESRSDDYRRYKRTENTFYRENERRKSPNKHDRWRRPTRSYSRPQEKDDAAFDKKKLLEIARKNAIEMMKSGNMPLGHQEKVLAAIRAGGKSIKELTEFCKTLSKKEEEMQEMSDEGSGNEHEGETTDSKAFHHPFLVKDRPTSIVMNIKNSVPLPVKTSQERNTELRLQFPVSSGSQHRKTENNWVPVSPKEPAETPPEETTVPVAVEPPENDRIFQPAEDPNIDLSQIVSQRLLAMRKLQENPYDVEALTTINKSQKEMQNWAESKQVPGQFTGSTGANILTQAELASGYQAWAKKDQLQNAAPVSGGMGMQLLKKMGWTPGEGLGKDKSGALQPLLLEVKLDKKGLVANEEQKKKQTQIKRPPKTLTQTLEGKHPVSLLGEFTAKKKLGAPEYTLCFESGPDHKKSFLFQVEVNGLVCKPEAASLNKKQAKADAAKLCLQKLGLLPV